MSQLYGYAGKILKVDLSSQRTKVLPTADYADFVGDAATGRQTRAKLEELGLKEVARELEKRGLLA